MNKECKIELKDTMIDIVVKMSEGNIGAVTCLMEMIEKKDWYYNTPSLLMIMNFDSLGLYGSKIYMLWNDCCDRDLVKLELVLRNWQMGKLSESEIYNNLNQGRGTPFTNLKSLEELFGIGDISYGVNPKFEKNSKNNDVVWYDEGRLEVIENKIENNYNYQRDSSYDQRNEILRHGNDYMNCYVDENGDIRRHSID